MKRLPLLALVLLLAPVTAFASDSFVPLTQIPGLTNLVTSPSIPAFLNALYRICVGAVAMLAVFQIAFAGWEFMTSKDSIAKNQRAKRRIGNAIFGLVLVLSPTIVFSLINPQILNLNFDVSALGSAPASGSSGGGPSASTNDTTNTAGVSGGNACSTYQSPTAVAAGSDQIASLAHNEYVQVSDSCCSSLQAGYQCWAQPKS